VRGAGRGVGVPAARLRGVPPPPLAGSPSAFALPAVRMPLLMIVSPRYWLPVGLLSWTSPAPSLIRFHPAPWSLISPVMLSTPAFAPSATLLSRITGPAQVLFPARFKSAPALAPPSPLSGIGSLIGPVIVPVELLTRSDEPGLTTVSAVALPRANWLVMIVAPALFRRVIVPVNPLLLAERVRSPGPSLVSVEPVLPLRLPETVRLPPALTVNVWSRPVAAPGGRGGGIVWEGAPLAPATPPLPETGRPGVIALPPSVYPPTAKVIELNVAAGRSLEVFGRAVPCDPNTRSSTAPASPVGATPLSQFVPTLHKLFVAPVQVNVVGVTRFSNSSHRRAGNGRMREGLRDDQPVHRRLRTI